MIKAIIFDLNGVFIQSPRLSDRFNEKFGIPVESFLVALKEVMAKARMPEAGDSFRYWEPYLQEWGVNITRDQFFDFWFSAEKAIPELIAYARELKSKGFQLFILSNNFIERANYYSEHFSFLSELFAKVYYSWQTGYVKPDREAFKLLLSENNLSPDECVFFDDSEHNIDVARELGMYAHIYEGLEKMKEIIEHH